MKVRIGTRGSPLARWQAEWIAAQLQAMPGVAVQIVEIRTQGDVRGQSISELSGQGVFTKEIQHALLSGKIDAAVHSLKDLPTETPPGLELVAIPPRESAADVLVSREGKRLADLKAGAAIGTGSARRRAQLLYARRDLVMADIRGNLDTRLRKLNEGRYDALVLAEAGLKRLGLSDCVSQVLSNSIMLPAVGQGALGIEARRDDQGVCDMLRRLDDRLTHQAVDAERALLAGLRGGCLAPVAALCTSNANGNLTLSAAVLSHDGRQRLFAEGASAIDEARQLGERLANELLAQGADQLIELSRRGFRL